MEDIKDEWAKNNYDKEGKYKAPMPEVLTKKYIKRLLDREVLKKAGSNVQLIDNMHDNHSLINISPNPVQNYATVNLNLPSQSTVSIKIYSQSILLHTMFDNKKLETGKHEFSLNTGELVNGIYVCIIEINNVRYVRKFLKK